MINETKNKLIVGKFILDTLSTGMYNNPLMVIREYIQNAVDALDESIRRKQTDDSFA